eukprot:3440734-Lingulodinium_polyedra.AAC.3
MYLIAYGDHRSRDQPITAITITNAISKPRSANHSDHRSQRSADHSDQRSAITAIRRAKVETELFVLADDLVIVELGVMLWVCRVDDSSADRFGVDLLRPDGGCERACLQVLDLVLLVRSYIAHVRRKYFSRVTRRAEDQHAVPWLQGPHKHTDRVDSH